MKTKLIKVSKDHPHIPFMYLGATDGFDWVFAEVYLEFDPK